VPLRVTRLLLQDPVRIETTTVSRMELQLFVGWFGGRTSKSNSTCTPNRLNYCVLFTVDTHFTNVAAGRVHITWWAAWNSFGRNPGININNCLWTFQVYIRMNKIYTNNTTTNKNNVHSTKVILQFYKIMHHTAWSNNTNL